VIGELVVDASAVFGFLAPGGGERPADPMFEALRGRPPIVLLAPDLVLLEVASATRRAVLRGDLPPEAGDRAIRRLGQLPLATVTPGGLLAEAWSLRGSLTIYDAAYAALAKGLRLPLVTADGRLARTARSLGIDAYELGVDDLGQLLAD